MSRPEDFVEMVQAIISRHPKTSLADRWADARFVDPRPSPDASWVRESDDLVNIVWLVHGGIIDITWFPASQTGTFNYMPLANIADIEVRQGPNLGEQMGLSISGDLVVRVRGSVEGGGVVWIASDRRNATQLRRFVGALLKRIA
jgi:hypothetical protein